MKDGRWGFVDKNGNEVVKLQYDAVTRFSKGGIAGAKKWGMWGLINGKGEEISTPQYYRVFTEGRSNLIAVNRNGKWGFLQDVTGEKILELQYDGYHFLVSLSDNALAIPKEKKYALFDFTGKQLTDFEYDNFMNITLDPVGVAYVEKNGKRGVIDSYGNLKIEPIYDELRLHGEMSDNPIFRAKKDGKIGYVNLEGDVVFPFKYVMADHVQEDLLLVRSGGLYGFMNKEGDLDVALQFHDARVYNEGLAPVKKEPFGKWGYIAHPHDQPAEWAKIEVDAAVEQNLIPSIMQYGYSHNITRIEFSHLLKQFIEMKTGKSLDEIRSISNRSSDRIKFQDTKDEAILALHALGIVHGKGEGYFDPYGEISRQEAAVLITRTAQLLGISGDPRVEYQRTDFKDDAEIQDWAKEAVQFVSSIEDSTSGAKVMGGTGENKFSPNASLTKQQAFIMMLRLFRVA
jgi:hypothetical protein